MNIINIFNKVRDIPYNIPIYYGDKDDCCSGKSEMLFNLLKSKRYKVRYRVCVFLWDQLPLPKEIMKIPHDKDCTHTYLEIFMDNKWRTLDATWDIGLKGVFYVNEWDGKSSTQIAVKPIKIFPLKKSLSIVKNQTKEVIDNDLSRNKNFYIALNKWLERVRAKI